MTIDELRKQLADAELTVKNGNKAISEARQRIAELTCPFHVGDRIPMVGYSYRGKEVVVRHIIPARWSSFGNDWRIVGNLVKANGEEGTRRTEFDKSDYDRAERDKAGKEA